MSTEQEIAEANAAAYSMEGKTYSRISMLGFIVVVILTYIINIIVTLILYGASIVISVAWLATIGLLFIFSYKKVGTAGTGSGTAYLFVFSSVIFLGNIAGAILTLVSFTLPSIMAGLVGVVFAYFKLQNKDML